jgi:hypothetical protein
VIAADSIHLPLCCNLPTPLFTITLPFDAVEPFQLAKRHFKKNEPERKDTVFFCFSVLCL